MAIAQERSVAPWLHPLLFAAALALVAWTVLATLAGAPVDPNSDDGFYLRYMQAVHERGLSALPGLFDAWNADPASWIYPPPSRVGFVAVSAAWAGAFGATMRALQLLSIASHLAGAVLNYAFARRHLGEPRALFVGVLWAFSPLLMGLSRLALTDSFIALCTSATIWTFFELLQAPERWSRRVAFMVALGFMVLVKELTVLLAAPLVALALLERFWRRRPLPLGGFSLCFVLPGVVTSGLFLLAAGGVRPLLETTRIVLASPATNDYAIKYGSGPWFRYLIDFLCLSPWTTLLALGFVGVLVARLRGGDYDRTLVGLGLVATLLVLELSFFTKNVRYAVGLELPMRVFAVGMLGEVFKGASAARTALLCGGAVALLCWLDWRSFDLYWVRYHGYDPVTYWLIAARHMLPFPVR